MHNFEERCTIRLEDVQAIHRLLNPGSDEGESVLGQVRYSPKGIQLPRMLKRLVGIDHAPVVDLAHNAPSSFARPHR